MIDEEVTAGKDLLGTWKGKRRWERTQHKTKIKKEEKASWREEKPLR